MSKQTQCGIPKVEWGIFERWGYKERARDLLKYKNTLIFSDSWVT